MISKEDYLAFVDEALDDMCRIVAELGDEGANRRLDAPGSNSPFAILTHCLGVIEYWAGQVAAGRQIVRDREAEFRASGPVSELLERVREQRQRLASDLELAQPQEPPRGPLPEADRRLYLGRTQGGALIHVFDELARHRGQMEVTRDQLQRG